jgi:hypothetical protein
MKSALLFIFSLLIFPVFWSPPYAYAAKFGGDHATIGPLPCDGTVKVYYQNMSTGVENWVDITTQSGDTERVQIPAGKCSDRDNCSYETAITSLEVKEGENFSVYFHGPGKHAQGWTDPVTEWTCGQQGVGDGLYSFAGLEAEVEQTGAPVIGRQCWEDLAEGSDNDWNDVFVLYTYNAMCKQKIDFMAAKVGHQDAQSVDSLTLPVCTTPAPGEPSYQNTEECVQLYIPADYTSPTSLLDRLLQFFSSFY